MPIVTLVIYSNNTIHTDYVFIKHSLDEVRKYVWEEYNCANWTDPFTCVNDEVVIKIAKYSKIQDPT